MENSSDISTEIVLHNPNGDQQAIVAMRQMLMDNQRIYVETIERNTEAIDATTYAKMKLNAFSDFEDAFKTAGDKLAKEIAAQSGADAVLVQIAASLTAVKSAIKAYQVKLRAVKAENEPPAEKLEYIVELCVTQKDFEAITKKWYKDGVEFRARRVKDNESAKIGKLFEEVK